MQVLESELRLFCVNKTNKNAVQKKKNIYDLKFYSIVVCQVSFRSLSEFFERDQCSHVAFDVGYVSSSLQYRAVGCYRSYPLVLSFPHQPGPPLPQVLLFQKPRAR